MNLITPALSMAPGISMKGIAGLAGMATMGSIVINQLSGQDTGSGFDFVGGLAEVTGPGVGANGTTGSLTRDLGSLAGSGVAAITVGKIAQSAKLGKAGTLALVGIAGWQGFQLLGEILSPDGSGALKDGFDIAGNITTLSMIAGVLMKKDLKSFVDLFSKRGKLLLVAAKHKKAIEEVGKGGSKLLSGNKLAQTTKRLDKANKRIKDIDSHLLTNFQEIFQPLIDIVKPITGGAKKAWVG